MNYKLLFLPLLAFMLLVPCVAAAQEATGTASSCTVGEEDIDKYPTTDIRNALTGVIPGLVIREMSGAPGLVFYNENQRTSAYSRGAAPIIYVDGIPVYAAEINIDAQEIESIRFIRDIAEKASIGGVRGCDGIIWITTKRNSSALKRIRAGFESGVNILDRFPEWVSDASEYATMFNQARDASGYAPYYTDEQIQAYKGSDAYNLKYPSINWRELLYKNVAPFNRAFASLDGSNGRYRYSAHFGYAGEGDFYAAGQDSGFHRFNLRTNVEADINEALSFHLGFFGGYSMRVQPQYGSTSSYFEFGDFLNATNTIPSNAYPLLVSTDETTGIRTWGVSRLYTNNPYASLLECGFTKDRTRTGMVNADLTYDVKRFVPGLKLNAYIALEDYTHVRLASSPDYLAVIYDPETEETTKTGHEGAKVSGLSNTIRRYRQGIYFRSTASYDAQFGSHGLRATASFHLEDVDRYSWSAHERMLSGVGTVSYNFKNRLLLDLVFNTTGSSMFARGHRFGFFPSAGLAWRITDNISLRAQGGILGGSTLYQENLFEDNYSSTTGVKYGPASTGYQWLGSTTRYQGKDTRLDRLGNPNLSWEKRYEAEAGIDASLLSRRLTIQANGYVRDRNGVITNTASLYPRAYGLEDTEVYENYNEYLYYGAELTMRWSDRIGDFHYSIGGDICFNEGKYLKYAEVFTQSYSVATGHLIGRVNGYRCIGRFTSQEEIDNSPRQMLSDKVKVGDLKYEDRNHDGVVDSKDVGEISNGNEKIAFALSFSAQYKGFELSVVGTGRALYSIMLNNDFYWNGWSNGNYSVFVRDNIGGAYPALEYDKNANNFVSSDFWLKDGSYFKIQNVEFAYNFKFYKDYKMKVFLRGANLLTISGFKYTDPENINAGVSTYPLTRTITCGAKLTF